MYHVGSRVPLLLPRAAKIRGMREKRCMVVEARSIMMWMSDNEEGMVDMDTVIKD